MDEQQKWEGMTKVAELRKGDFEAKLYLGNKSIGQVRDIFRARTNTVEGNVKNIIHIDKIKNQRNMSVPKDHPVLKHNQ